MTVPILCVVCFFFLCWILILKGEVDHMKKEIERIKMLLKTKLGRVEKDIEVERGH